MGKLLDEIGRDEKEFIAKQKVFFVATAPLDSNHSVNVSPKAPGSSVVVLGPNKVAYADLTGSGSEAAAHVLENRRMTLMFCNLEEGPPKILRLHGKAKVVVKEDVDDALLQKFPVALVSSLGFRAIFVLSVERVSSSCGYSLPVMTYQKTRKILDEFVERKGVEGMKEYSIYNNSFSIDGLPSIAHLRNKGVAIAPKSQEGYIHGERVGTVANDSPAHHSSSAIPIKLAMGPPPKDCRLILYGVLIFVAGMFFGYVLTQMLPKEAFILWNLSLVPSEL